MKYTRTNAFKEAVENVQLVILQNIVFTAVAIVRKTYVRLYFNNRNLKKQAKQTLTT